MMTWRPTRLWKSIQCESISRNYIDKSMFLAFDSIEDFQEYSFHDCHKLYPEIDKICWGFDESLNLERNVADDHHAVLI